MKKILTLILVLAAVLSVSGVALADETVTLDIANGPITVAAAEAGKVTYTQGGNTFPVSEDTPVTITGSYSYSTDNVNAIKITNCSPTIVLKDLTIKTTGGRKTGSNILIDGTAANEVKFIISGNNTIERPNVTGSASEAKKNCGIEVRNATLTIDCETHKGVACNDVNCPDKLNLKVYVPFGAAIGSRSVGYYNDGNAYTDTDGDGINENEPEGFTLNIDGGYIDAFTKDGYRYGAALGRGYVQEPNAATKPIAINIRDGYVKATAPDCGIAIGSNSQPENVSVAISGGVVDAVSTCNNRGAIQPAISAGNLEITNDADVTVQGNIQANIVTLKDSAELEVLQKSGWVGDESQSNNPGGSIGNGAEWDVKDEDGNVIETVVSPGNVQVKVSDGATLTTAGGINGSLSTSGNATANINGVAPQSGKAGTDKNVGGVSGDVTVGADSTVSVAEDVRGDATVEKGGTLNYEGEVGKLDAAPGSIVNGIRVLPEIIEGANGTFNGQAEGLPFTSNADYEDLECVKVDGDVVDEDNYIDSEGSTVVTLKASYLKTLAEGVHTLTIESKTGAASASFTVDFPDPVYTGGSSYSGPSIWYIGGNTFGTSTTQMPTSVEIDYVSVPFTMEGSNIVVSCINPGARWATVKWNSTSATINFNPDANVVCAQVVIPKTGDMPIWAAIAEFLGF